MIYLLCKYDIISVPFICRRHISSTEGGYHIEDISPVPIGTDIIEKAHFCLTDKSVLFLGAGGGGRTRTVLLPTDFESVTSANSITPAYISAKPH